MTTDIKKRICLRFSNCFTKQELFTLEMPYLPFWAINGYYSSLYKTFKSAAAFKFDKKLVKGKHWFKSDKSNRSIISFPNGMKLDYPYDVTKQDIKIILHNLEGIKMSLQN